MLLPSCLCICRSGSTFHLFAVNGVHNYTCDPSTGTYQFRGWIVNGTDVRNDKHTGASPGPNQALLGLPRLALNALLLQAAHMPPPPAAAHLCGLGCCSLTCSLQTGVLVVVA